MTEMQKDEWARVVVSVLADHPDWIAVTVECMQAGVVEAIDRQKDRSLTLSLGLVQAVGSPLRGARRNHDQVIDAIQVSHFHPTKWSESAIARETQHRDRKKNTG